MITPLFEVSKGDRPRLRIGVLVDGPLVPRYVATILEDIARSNFADVVLVVVHCPVLDHPLSGLAHELYLRVDRLVAGDGDPLVLVDPGMGTHGADRLEVSSTDGRSNLRISAADLAEIRRRDLDVLLRFCTAVPRGELLGAARYGVWSYHFGADDRPRGGAPYFTELAEQAPTRPAQLEVLDDDPSQGLVLCQSIFGRQKGPLLAKYREAPIWESTHFVLWKLHDLHELGWDHVRSHGQPHVPAARTAGTARTPTTLEMTRFLGARVALTAENRLKGQSFQQTRWKIGLRRTKTLIPDAKDPADLSGFRLLDAPPDHYWADPFLIEHGGATFLFYEDFDRRRTEGVIGRAEVLPDGTLGPAEVCLDAGYHLSFPFVFEHDGEVFMLPESLANGTVTLYRARRFPDEWVQEKVLFRGNAFDTSLFHDGSHFYFFTALCDRDHRGMKALLFVADSLTGDWRLHPENPLSSDARNARNAGAVFRHEGRLFRPAQDCGPHYGYAFSLQEIVTLSPDRYEERLFSTIDPEHLPIPAQSVHTYNHCRDIEVIDIEEPMPGRKR